MYTLDNEDRYPHYFLIFQFNSGDNQNDSIIL